MKGLARLVPNFWFTVILDLVDFIVIRAVDEVFSWFFIVNKKICVLPVY